MKRNLKIYIPIILLLFAIGLPTRTIPQYLPTWYINYAGDFWWAMLIFFLFCVILRLKNTQAFYIALATTYIIEITQLFHPAWLEALRSVKLFALILGYTFLWSDIVAYTLGISLGALIDRFITNRIDMKVQQNTVEKGFGSSENSLCRANLSLPYGCGCFHCRCRLK